MMMRTLTEILDAFPDWNIDHIHSIFSGNCDPESKLDLAMKVLDLRDIEMIPFSEDKEEYLDYKYWLSIFETSPEKAKAHISLLEESHVKGMEIPKYDQVINSIRKFRGLRFTAYKVIQSYPEVFKSRQDYVYSPYAQGLSSLLHQRSDRHRQDFVHALSQYCDGIEEAEIIQFIDRHHGDIDAMFERTLKCKNTNDNGPCEPDEEAFREIKKFLPDYYKSDYQPKTQQSLPKKSGKKDAQRTFMRQSKKYYNGSANNTNAILKTLSNDFASIFMQTQKQKLYVTEYSDHSLEYTTHAELVPGEDFGHEKRKLVGGKDDIHNYRGIELLMPREGIATVTDNTIMNLCRHLVPLLLTGDPDKMGSHGQNLKVVPVGCDDITGRKTYELVGMDFGRALRGKNPLLANKMILPDARFIQPSKNPFKNFSALSDGSLSEKMQGVHLLAKIFGISFDDEIIASYGDEFFNAYQKIEAKEGNSLCESYILAQNTLEEEDFDNASEYDHCIKMIANFGTQMNEDLHSMHAIFLGYLHHPAKAVDLADNLNKLCAAERGKTSLRSLNKKHGLMHIVMDESHLKTWSIASGEKYYQFTCFFSKEGLKKLQPILERMKGENNFIHISKDRGKLKVYFERKYLDKACEIFSEENIMLKYHAEDYAAIQAAYTEIRLRDLIAAEVFVANKINMELMLHPEIKDRYRIIVKNGNQLMGELGFIVQDQFGTYFAPDNTMSLDFDCHHEELFRMINAFEKIQACFADYVEKVNKAKQREEERLDVVVPYQVEITASMISLPVPTQPDKSDDEKKLIPEMAKILEPEDGSDIPLSNLLTNGFFASCVFMPNDKDADFKLKVSELLQLYEKMDADYVENNPVGSKLYFLFSSVMQDPWVQFKLILQNYMAAKNDNIATIKEALITRRNTLQAQPQPIDDAEIKLLNETLELAQVLIGKNTLSC